MSRPTVFLIVLSSLVASAPGQDPEPAVIRTPEERKIPILGNIPILGSMFRQRSGESLWFPLDGLQGIAPRDEAKPGELPFRVRWLMDKVQQRFDDVKAIELVEHKTVRHRAGERQVEAHRGLEVFAPKASLPKIEEWLEQLTRAPGRMLQVKATIVRGGKLVKEQPGQPVPQIVELDRKSYDRLIREAKQQPIEIVSAPAITIFDGQRGNVSILNQTSYVKDFEVEVVQGASIADPVIDVVQEGYVIDVTPVVHPDEKHVSLEARVRVSSLKRPIKQFTTTLGTGSKVTIELPEVSTSEFKTEELVMPIEGTFVVTGLAQFEGDWSKEPIPVDVLFQITRVTLPDPATELGKVVGVDRAANRVFVELEGPTRVDRRNFAIYRDERQVVRLRLVANHGRVLILEPLTNPTEVKVGDRVR